MELAKPNDSLIQKGEKMEKINEYTATINFVTFIYDNDKEFNDHFNNIIEKEGYSKSNIKYFDNGKVRGQYSKLIEKNELII